MMQVRDAVVQRCEEEGEKLNNERKMTRIARRKTMENSRRKMKNAAIPAAARTTTGTTTATTITQVSVGETNTTKKKTVDDNETRHQF
jgi:hypothetical protein